MGCTFMPAGRKPCGCHVGLGRGGATGVTRMDAVVVDIAHPAQHDALREGAGALAVAGAQLAQHRDQAVADERVDLVDEQHQRPRVGLAPAPQRRREGAVGAGGLEDAGPALVHEPVAQHLRLVGQFAEDGPHGAPHVLARRLGGLDIGVDAAKLARRAAVEQVAQRQQDGGLAGLPRRLQHEIAPAPDQPQDLVEVYPFERRHAVMPLGYHGALSVEHPHGRHPR